MKLFSSLRGGIIGLFVGIGALLYGHSAIAAESVVFRYGMFN
jgi:hypothetical protein